MFDATWSEDVGQCHAASLGDMSPREAVRLFRYKRFAVGGLLTAFLALALCVVPQSAFAEAEPLTPCTAEPTNMSIAFGDVVDCDIDVPGDLDLFRFQGSAGSVIVLSLRDEVGTCGTLANYPCPVIELFEPESVIPFLTIGPGTASQSLELAVSGTYTIRVTESGNDQTTGYRVGLERLFPTSPTAQALPWDNVIADETIDPTPDQDFYTFEAAQGAFVSLSLIDRTGTCGTLANYPCPEARLFAPDETEVIALGAGTDSADIELTQGGVYTVHVFESGNDQNETYNLGLQCLFPPVGQEDCQIQNPCEGLTCDGLAVTICGTDGDDNLTGTDGDDVIAGLDGRDFIDGGSGADTICGGAGNDTLTGADGNDRLFGETGDDVLVGDDGNDRLDGGTGRDVLLGMAGRDVLIGRGGDDVLVGGADADRLLAGTGLYDLCDQEADTIASTGCEILRDP